MKRLFIAGIMLASVPFVSFAQTAATGTTTVTPPAATRVVNPGFIPGDFFYFLDGLGEQINLALTFNKEKKAALHLQYAKERVAEINEVLKNPRAKLENVASAKSNFDAQVADAAAIVKSEKEAGVDVSLLARELGDELDTTRGDLKDTLSQHQDNLAQTEAEIRARIDAINASGTASTTSALELKGLTQSLDQVTKEQSDAMSEEDGVDAGVAEEQATFEQVMGKEMAAQKHLEQATRLQEHLDEISGHFGNISTTSARLMMDAQDAIKRGDFEAARHMSKDAEKGFERAKEMRGNMKRGGQQSEQGVPLNGGMINGNQDNFGGDQIPFEEGDTRSNEQGAPDFRNGIPPQGNIMDGAPSQNNANGMMQPGSGAQGVPGGRPDTRFR